MYLKKENNIVFAEEDLVFLCNLPGANMIEL
jgi:hypothetical protein